MSLSPAALAIVLAVALSYFVGVEVVAGVKWVGKETKRAGAAVVHVLKKIPHPRRDDR